MNLDLINILLATYNGEKYLEEQLNSITTQTYTNWKLIIGDDGSNDATVQIIENFCRKYPEKTIFITERNINQGACNNFSRLLAFAESDYIMFCDQDDIWLPDKIEISFKEVKRLESEYGTSTPVLIYTDLKIVDKNLNTIAESLWVYKQINPDNGKYLNRLLIQNSINGCTTMINASLKKLVDNIPQQALMHDWWIAMVACVFGKTEYITKATMLYRQHEKNLTNSRQGLNSKYIINKIFSFYDRKQLLNDFSASQKQARFFLERYEGRLNKNDLNKLKVFIDLHLAGFFKKRFLIIKYGFLKNNFIGNIGLLLRL